MTNAPKEVQILCLNYRLSRQRPVEGKFGGSWYIYASASELHSTVFQQWMVLPTTSSQVCYLQHTAVYQCTVCSNAETKGVNNVHTHKISIVQRRGHTRVV